MKPNNNCGECHIWLAVGEIGGPTLEEARRDHCSKCDLWDASDDEIIDVLQDSLKGYHKSCKELTEKVLDLQEQLEQKEVETARKIFDDIIFSLMGRNLAHGDWVKIYELRRKYVVKKR